MNKSVSKAAIKFIKKDIKKKTDFKSVASYLKTQGYAVVFYEHDKNNELIDKYNLSEYSKTVDAFTFRKNDLKIVFINANISSEDKLFLLLHETGHIILEHLSEDKLISNSRLQDIEADAFAHTVLNPPKTKLSIPVWIACIILSLSFASGVALSATSPSAATAAESYVYITSTGDKYHRKECIFANRTKTMAVEKSEAKQIHEPCLVCNP